MFKFSMNEKKKSEETKHECDSECNHENTDENDELSRISALEDLLVKARTSLETLSSRNEVLTKAYQELKNEYDASVNRHKKALEDSTKYACTDFAKILISAMDSFAMAMDLTKSMPTVYLGLKMTYDTLEQEMKKYGIIKMYCGVGSELNSNLHQVIGEVDMPDLTPGSIAQVLQNGYIIHDRILRPASVNIVKKE